MEFELSRNDRFRYRTRYFTEYYNFTPRFCNPGQGHEKGGVDGLVGYSRPNYMVPVPEADSLEELNKKLLQNCLLYGDHHIAGREVTVNELYEQEQQHLISLPDVAFSNLETSWPNPRQKISVDNQACFRYLNSYWFRLIDASICGVTADAGTQSAIYDSSAP